MVTRGLTKAELEEERRASAERRRATMAKIEKSPRPERIPGRNTGLRPRTFGRGRSRAPQPVLRTCACGEEFIATHGKQRLCLDCRAARASGR